jgi:hypothetical protein
VRPTRLARLTAELAINSPTESTRLSILNHLIRAAGEEWDRRLIVDKAVVVFRSATNTNSNEYQRLHTALLERGARGRVRSAPERVVASRVSDRPNGPIRVLSRGH